MRVAVGDVTVREMALTGATGLAREIRSPQINTPDLFGSAAWRDMASSVVHLRPTQLARLTAASPGDRMRMIKRLLREKPACIVISGGNVPHTLLNRARAAKIPVFKSRSIAKLVRLLIEKLSPRISLHGVLVQIFGLGTLILGESAIGKSEAALDLVLRGHKLAADDVVLVEKTDQILTGRASEMGGDLLQIRGLGVINVRALYGESATIGSCRIGLVVELEEWKKGQHYSLVGLRERRFKLLGVNLPYLKLPVKPGRNMATLIEVAARNQMLKNRGVYTARDLHRRLIKRLAG